MIRSLFSQLTAPLSATGLLILGLMAPAASAQSLDLIIDQDGGAVYFKNSTDAPIVFDAYELVPISFDLVIDNWTPIAGNYDTAGDQSVDSTAAWFIGAETISGVAEASPVANSASLSPGQIVDLGLIALGNPFENNLILELASGVETETIFADTRDLTADYDADLDVDLFDYLIYSSTYGSTIDLRADGNNDGVIDAADYTVWRDSPELALAAASASLSFAIPEPSSVAIVSLAALLISSGPLRPRAARATAS